QIPSTITVAAGGELGARSTNATATLTGTVSMTPDASNTLYFNADEQTQGNLVLTTLPNIAATSDLTIQVGLNGTGTDFRFPLTNVITTGTVTLNALISRNVTVIKTGGGALALTNNANPFGGAGKAVIIAGGNLTVGADGQLGNSANAINFTQSRTAALSA